MKALMIFQIYVSDLNLEPEASINTAIDINNNSNKIRIMAVNTTITTIIRIDSNNDGVSFLILGS